MWKTFIKAKIRFREVCVLWWRCLSYLFALRCSRLLAYDGIHFGEIIKDVSRKVGGTGGGHSVACGAYISQDKQNEFLNLLNQSLNDKLNI